MFSAKKCPYRRACKYLRSLLRQSQVVPTRCPTSFIECPCSSFILNIKDLHSTLPSPLAGKVLVFIKKLFGSDQLFFPKEPDIESLKDSVRFFCPELQISMEQPCLLTQCPFHTTNPFVQNCILRYLSLQEKEALSFNELTFLLNMPASVVKTKVSKAIRRTRKTAIRKMIEDGTQDGLITRVLTHHICAVCERTLGEEQITKKGVSYCSQFCFIQKPPKVVFLEQEFSYPISKLLLLCQDHFDDWKLVRSSLGIPTKMLKTLLTQHNISA